MTDLRPTGLTFTPENGIDKVLIYVAERDAEGRITFEIRKAGQSQAIPYKVDVA